MQHSSLIQFCEECGLANEPGTDSCAGCGLPLAVTGATPHRVPVVVTPPPLLEVTPGASAMPFTRDARGQLAQYPPCDFQAGSLFADRYEIKEEIGRGGFSTVYRAIDQEFGYHFREVAIKRIRLDQLTPRQVIDATETFNREIAMLIQLRQFGIPAYYDYLTDAENWYLVTQYIQGETLEAYMQKKPGGYLEEQEVITIGITLARLLQDLHSRRQPVIFRDLKPSNIMITPEQTFFLIDFGIARIFTPGKARDTTPLGSPGYAPPEQYGKAQTDQRSDIYSLGATLQTLLTGRDPLDLRSGLPSLNPQPLSPKLGKLLDAMLSNDVTQRPISMAIVARRLEYILHRPLALFLSNLVIALSISIFNAIVVLFAPKFRYLGIDPATLPVFAPLLAGILNVVVHKKMRIPKQAPKGFNRFQILGIIVGFLPLFILLLLVRWLH